MSISELFRGNQWTDLKCDSMTTPTLNVDKIISSCAPIVLNAGEDYGAFQVSQLLNGLVFFNGGSTDQTSFTMPSTDAFSVYIKDRLGITDIPEGMCFTLRLVFEKSAQNTTYVVNWPDINWFNIIMNGTAPNHSNTSTYYSQLQNTTTTTLHIVWQRVTPEQYSWTVYGC